MSPKTEQNDIPDTQHAVVQDSNGKPILVDNAAIPPLKPATILVRTKAVALNPSDYKMGSKFPSPGAIVGMDFAGIIVTMGLGTVEIRPDLKIGDSVCGSVHGSNPADRENGAFAEYIRATADLVIKIPKNMSYENAATVGVSLTTSYLALWNSLGIIATPDQPAEKPYDVLVYGGSTSCGTIAIQLLRLSGLNPITTCSPRNFGLVKSLGASAAFDYNDLQTPTALRDYTKNRLRYIVDCITDSESIACCYIAMGRTGGRYSCLELCPDHLRSRKAVKVDFVMAMDVFGVEIDLSDGYERKPSPKKHADGVRWMAIFQRLLTEGKLKVHPTKNMGHGLKEVLNGLDILKEGNISGQKLVVTIN